MKLQIDIKNKTSKFVKEENWATTEQLLKWEKEKQIPIKIARLEELSKDIIQVQAGLIVPDIEDKKKEFRTLLNEVRILQNKLPRTISFT